MKQIQKILSIFLLSILLLEGVFASSGDNAIIEEKNKTADSSSFLGIKKSRSAVILDNFKNKQQNLLFENVPITSQDEELIFDSDSKLRALEDILKRVEDRKETLKDKKRNITTKKFDLKSALEDLDNSIAETEKSIIETQESITEKNRDISEFGSKIKNLNDKITNNKKTILKYLTYIYSKGEGMYGEDNNIDVVRSIILNDGNLGDLLNDIHFKTLIELSGQNLVDLHRDLVKEYYYNKEELKKQKIEIVRLKGELTSKNKDLNSQKEYKEELLSITKGQESLYNKIILQKVESENKIKEQIENMNIGYNEVFNNIGSKYDCNIKFSTGGVIDIGEAKNDESSKCIEIRQYFSLEKKLREVDNGEMDLINPLSWPAEPSRGISTYFHDEGYYTSLGSEHEAIDIRYSQGTDLVAPASGYVYFVNPPVKGGYSYLALKHSNGFVTVYGHLSEVSVNQFDFVEAGQVFAKSGGAPGTPGAGPMTSGPHLHYEVFKDRKNVDPLNYMDTTHLSFDKLTTKYRYKYIEDLKIKFGNKVNLDKFQKFYIAGDSEIDRQKYLLSKYASSNFNDWNIWAEEAINGKIDPSFLMCVGLAETGLGKHLKTGFNVGNIGNTDSGGTYGFDSPREGIYRMVKTLNNRYLNKYNSIDMLSRRGNKNGSIYASSSSNWHNNVVKCLSSLKGRYIEDDYKFRLVDME
ncbi:MAG: peptidoglycan DD-metalloendopeptidase family protein [Candidatus Gracilibacteria bacterium]|nr:peptidoglycan DD-metalloendopeptidase family protein [Candidatus Gracilibacteria bacterium]MDD2909103.1 peptidoglycan DD-metalloendopeptidase family protein [Candidatus Gracilibacteria bacterium]